MSGNTQLLGLAAGALAGVTLAVSGQTLAYYHFDGSAGSPASILTDSGPAHLDGTNQGIATYSSGVLSNCLNLSGDLNYGSLPNSPTLTLTNDWTIEFFFKANQPYTTYGSDPSTMLNKLHTPSTGDYLDSFGVDFYANGGVAGRISFAVGNGVTIFSAASLNYGDGLWHHLALTYSHQGSNSTLTLYLDYAVSASSSGAFPPIAWGSFPVSVGAGNFPAGQDTSPYRRNFDGQIDELRFSSVALAPDQFITLPAGRYPQDSISGVGNGTRLSILSRSNHVYQVQYRDDVLKGLWTNTGALLPGTGNQLSVTNAFAPGVNRRFFRVVESP
jgi:hypothetical protein